tara:strand:- start:1459 stop:1686 length:228 start_codon:yes stop_codon:yes gene_type:complete
MNKRELLENGVWVFDEAKHLNIIISLYEARTSSLFRELPNDDYDKQQIKDIIYYGESIECIVDELVKYAENEGVI